MNRKRKLITGFTGSGLVAISFVLIFTVANTHAGGLLALITGGLGYLLVFASGFIPWEDKE